MKPEYIIFGIVGVVILWFVSRYAGSSAPTIEYAVAQPDTESGDAQAQIEAQQRMGALQLLGSLAETETAAGVTRFQTEAQLTATRIAADLQRAGIEADERLGTRQIEAQENIYLSDLSSRAAQERLHADTITKFVRENRGKISTDSSTVIFNALSSAFGRQQVPFVPERAKWYAPITQGLGRLIGGLGVSVATGGAR